MSHGFPAEKGAGACAATLQEHFEILQERYGICSKRDQGIDPFQSMNWRRYWHSDHTLLSNPCYISITILPTCFPDQMYSNASGA